MVQVFGKPGRQWGAGNERVSVKVWQSFGGLLNRMLWFPLVGGCLIAGCGYSSRASLEGTVTLDEQPLPSGSITFVPLVGTQSPTAGGEIVDGKFEVPAQGGTYSGKFRVEINASRANGEKVPHPGSGQLVDTYEQYLPPQYNSDSELEVEVHVGQLNRFEFALLSH
jgi:hypothetical protein